MRTCAIRFTRACCLRISLLCSARTARSTRYSWASVSSGSFPSRAWSKRIFCATIRSTPLTCSECGRGGFRLSFESLNMASRPVTTAGPEIVPRTCPRAMSVALALLVISVFINYVDRGNLSIAAPLLKDELGISASQLGILLSSFFWTYTACLFLCGWFVDHFDVTRVLACGLFLWSLATAATGAVHGFTMLLIARMVLGMGESVAFPCYCKILARHLPEHYRGFANGAIIAGMKFGPAAGTLGAGML